MRITSSGHAAFAAAMIALGAVGLANGDYAGAWGGVPASMPARVAFAYVCALVALVSGAGLLWRPTAAFAARALWAYLTLWLIVFKIPFIFRAPLQEVSYQTCGETAVIVAAAWVLQARLMATGERTRLSFFAGDTGVRIARILYGLALIAFGLSHFFYLQMTAPLVPQWLPLPAAWAYLTGGTYLAAGIAVLTGVLARPAAILSAVQMAGFLLLVWIPRAANGNLDTFQWGEVLVTFILTASAWVIAESYRDTPARPTAHGGEGERAPRRQTSQAEE